MAVNPRSYRRRELREFEFFLQDQRARVTKQLNAMERRVTEKRRAIGQDKLTRLGLSLESDEAYEGGRGHAMGPKKPVGWPDEVDYSK